MSTPRRHARQLLTHAVVACLVAGALALVGAAPASAASTLVVTTTADSGATAGACGNPAIVTAPSPLTLREAVCVANNQKDAATITVPAGTYRLTGGELAIGRFAGQSVTVAGAGPAATIIDAGGTSRVLNLDPDVVGDVAVTISGVTITGGKDDELGGAGIIGGSDTQTRPDTLTVRNSVITGNVANAQTPARTNLPGGGIQFIGGSLTVIDSTISNNSSSSSPGAGLAYRARSTTSTESLSITGTTFSGNTTTSSSSLGTANGGALDTRGTSSSRVTVTGSRFVGNTVTATTADGAGAAIRHTGGALSVTGSTFTGNAVSGGASPGGGAVEIAGGTATLRHNRFAGNTAASGSAIHAAAGAGAVDAELNWFGCNAAPGGAGCDTVASDGTAVDVSPRLQLKATATPSTVTGPDATSTVRASLLTDSDGGAVRATDLTAFDGLPVTWSAPRPAPATINGGTGASTVNLSGGEAQATYDSKTSGGPGSVTATLDNASVTPAITVQRPLVIDAQPTDQSVDIGETATFTVKASGYPAPSVQWQRSTDGGTTFTDVADATSSTYSFTAKAADNGNRYRAVVSNGADPSLTSTAAKLTVVGPAQFTSADTATFVRGAAGSFTITTTGLPTVSTISRTGDLPAGLTFTDNGDGTATVAGAPTGATGRFPIDLAAQNGIDPSGTQTLTIVVDAAPQVTTDPSDRTVEPGTSVSFTAAASGSPTPTVQWQRSTDGGASFANVAGATSTTFTFAAARGDDGNRYRAVFTNTRGTATSTAATLRVGTAPSFTSSDRTTFAVGSTNDFVVRASGVPAPSFSTSGAQRPAWLTLTDNGDGTADLTGTPPVGSGGTYTLTLVASNGFTPSASQSFTLTVTEPPTFTSSTSASFTVGTAGSFTVATAAGFPTSTTLTATGSLPSGVTFTDNGDGTATIAGTPAAGTSGTYSLGVTAENAAGTAQQVLVVTVGKAPQAITVTSVAPTAPVVGDTYTPQAASDSDLAVTVSIDRSTTRSACSITDGVVTFDNAGTCVIAYDQTGDDTYAAAPKVTESIVVTRTATTLGLTTSASPSVFGQSVTATATVASATGTVSGTVQFTVDGDALGAPVTVVDGVATSPQLLGPGGDSLATGPHAVGATFTPTDAVRFDGANGSTTQVVNQSATTTKVDVASTSITATVTPVAPGRGTPTGSVAFSVGSEVVGTAPLVDGVATLDETVPAGLTREVAAVYGGDASFTGSSTSVNRNDPTITATVSSAHPRTSYGWYRSAVTVTFTCTTNGAALTEPCPAPVRFSGRGAGQSVTRTISSVDGGVATAVVSGINIDNQRPTLKIRGVKKGGVYGPRAPKARCVAKDSLSGVASCKVSTRKRGTTVTVTATATDRAGNTRSTSVRYRTSIITLEGAKFRNGAYDVRRGRTYTLVVHAGSRPKYYEAEVVPRTPRRFGGVMRKAGKGRYALGVTMTDLRGRTYWNLGVKVGKKMHIVRVRAKG
ncbi:immunoglobulin domain-containing protein [Aeromicrobium sp. CFBP 8757]|uniref:beta strand repeat-containing protein n=1 Tax=Aeromicrobium sp. CFBP 8757 TaxID=2775288 RepID=UPI00177F3C04|nr:immunoglobulin domain-containing protein [Aeromicrobium sp. CFBP 8757]MBD8608537.1 immunoglobulin domain-containing protein [Aeromicrobium sp. CFBP 8757]